MDAGQDTNQPGRTIYVNAQIGDVLELPAAGTVRIVAIERGRVRVALGGAAVEKCLTGQPHLTKSRKSR